MSLDLTDIQRTQRALKEGSTTVLDVVQSFLKNIEDSKEHNHFVEVFEKEALQKAKELDLQLTEIKESMPLLYGAVISIKDNIVYKDHSATAGSKMLDGFTSNYSSTAVERLIAQGAIIIGRTNCDEFGMGSTNENSFYGPVKNGQDKERVPGGSSGGAAVSVQLQCCHAALGSDTGGSVRQPAAFCNVMGFKPGYGRISRWGLISYASSFDQIGIIGHNEVDIAIILSVIGGPDNRDSTAIEDPNPRISIVQRDKNKYSFGFLKNALDKDLLDDPISTGFEEVMAHCARHHEVKEYNFKLLDYLVPCYYILTTAEASSNLGRYDGIRYGHNSEKNAETYIDKMMNNRTEGFGLEVKRRIMSGVYVLSEGYFDVYYKKAQQVRRLIKEEMEDLLCKSDFIVIPTTTTQAHKIGDLSQDPVKMYYSDIFTVLANICGLPAVSIPLKNKLGKSFSIQIIGEMGKEQKILQSVGHFTEMAYKLPNTL